MSALVAIVSQCQVDPGLCGLQDRKVPAETLVSTCGSLAQACKKVAFCWSPRSVDIESDSVR